MKKFALLILSICLTAHIFAGQITLENLTSYPSKSPKSQIAIQWASSGKEIDAENHALMHGGKINSSTLQALTKTGMVQLTIPKKAAYFRVVAWSKGAENPDLVTNWVDIVPNKTYTLEADHLSPAILMLGTGC